ncbi:MAG: hypothetical protein KatS3mg118_0794 [Paracoccaceae bacterium]|nr:MAG: hypothetical protein KatS3mg118_0794 [Paracoccaceae bacterium]
MEGLADLPLALDTAALYRAGILNGLAAMAAAGLTALAVMRALRALPRRG